MKEKVQEIKINSLIGFKRSNYFFLIVAIKFRLFKCKRIFKMILLINFRNKYSEKIYEANIKLKINA